MIIAEGLSKRFDADLVVDDVNFHVPAGQIMALLGPNGAGKTTTIRMLSSTLLPTSGCAQVAGFDTVTQAEEVRRSVGVLTEHYGLYTRMQPVEYLEFYGRLYGLSAADARLRAITLLDKFGLGDARGKRLGEFSRGMRQKLALVRALLHNPPVLLLDEPTSALDPDSARTVREAIGMLKEMCHAVILCTHNLSEAEALADQVAIIRRGKILFAGTKAELVEQFFGAPEYEARLTGQNPGWEGALPEGVTLTASGDDWLRFRVDNPRSSNAALMRSLLERQANLIAFQPVPHDLEQAYLAVVNQTGGGQAQ